MFITYKLFAEFIYLSFKTHQRNTEIEVKV